MQWGIYYPWMLMRNMLAMLILMLILMLLNLNTGYADTDADLCSRIMSLCCNQCWDPSTIILYIYILTKAMTPQDVRCISVSLVREYPNTGPCMFNCICNIYILIYRPQNTIMQCCSEQICKCCCLNFSTDC